MLAAVWRTPASLRSTSRRSAPASARAMDIARPMPCAAPVTTATLLVRSNRDEVITVLMRRSLMIFETGHDLGSVPLPGRGGGLLRHAHAADDGAAQQVASGEEQQAGTVAHAPRSQETEQMIAQVTRQVGKHVDEADARGGRRSGE